MPVVSKGHITGHEKYFDSGSNCSLMNPAQSDSATAMPGVVQSVSEIVAHLANSTPERSMIWVMIPTKSHT